jgi:hypothetical protein
MKDIIASYIWGPMQTWDKPTKDTWDHTQWQGLMFRPHAGFILEPHPIINCNKLQFINVVFEKVDETARVSLNVFTYAQNQYDYMH